MAVQLDTIPPPPLKVDSFEFQNWLNQVYRALTEADAIAWVRVDKTGSSLGDLETRRHDQLTELSDDDHSIYIHMTINRTVTAQHTWSNKQTFGGEIQVGGALNHDGTTVGFYGTTPATQAAAIADLTDNSGGTANDTLQAMPDPADAPASADALRDDIVANLLPPLRNNIADLGAKVDAITAALRTVGLIAT